LASLRCSIIDASLWALVFVTNALNGTVTRLGVTIAASGVTLLTKTTVAMGCQKVPNAAALVLDPTGLAYDELSDTLYVASTGDNAIYAISQAGHRISAAVIAYSPARSCLDFWHCAGRPTAICWLPMAMR
jgi:DNA-binding beta-propeller fold protein YncE